VLVAEFQPLAAQQRIGLIGGTFDPIHYAHLAIAEEVRVTLNLDTMVFIPAGQPPHKHGKEVTPANHRLAMVELAIASNPAFACSRIEIENTGPSYLALTLQRLRELWGPEKELYFVVGWDSLEEFHTWHTPQEILRHLTALVAVGRPGYNEDPDSQERLDRIEARVPGLKQRLLLVHAPLLDISATELRERVRQHRPIRYQVPDPVEQYIHVQRLYQE
jgi:nicotinate-nucleotide adenylyltransferase